MRREPYYLGVKIRDPVLVNLQFSLRSTNPGINVVALRVLFGASHWGTPRTLIYAWNHAGADALAATVLRGEQGLGRLGLFEVTVRDIGLKVQGFRGFTKDVLCKR